MYNVYYRHLFFLKEGADVNVVDNKNQTALFHATEQAHLNVVKFLLKFNADILIRSYNYSILMFELHCT